MPAPIIGAMIQFISSNTGMTCWDGEIPRYSTAQQAINPDLAPAFEFPVFKVFMKEDGFLRNWTFFDPYDDEGEILIQIWGVTRTQTETQGTNIETLLAAATNWEEINLGSGPGQPYVISCLLNRWYSGQEEGERTAQSQLLYRYDMHYDLRLHGSVSTS